MYLINKDETEHTGQVWNSFLLSCMIQFKLRTMCELSKYFNNFTVKFLNISLHSGYLMFQRPFDSKFCHLNDKCVM